MLYTRPVFSCPASTGKASQKDWDRIFMNNEDFRTKYADVRKDWFDELDEEE